MLYVTPAASVAFTCTCLYDTETHRYQVTYHLVSSILCQLSAPPFPPPPLLSTSDKFILFRLLQTMHARLSTRQSCNSVRRSAQWTRETQATIGAIGSRIISRQATSRLSFERASLRLMREVHTKKLQMSPTLSGSSTFLRPAGHNFSSCCALRRTFCTAHALRRTFCTAHGSALTGPAVIIQPLAKSVPAGVAIILGNYRLFPLRSWTLWPAGHSSSHLFCCSC